MTNNTDTKLQNCIKFLMNAFFGAVGINQHSTFYFCVTFFLVKILIWLFFSLVPPMSLSLFCECSGDSSITFSHRFEKGTSNRKTIQSDLEKKDSLPSWHFFVRHMYQMQIITVISLSLGQSFSFP